jgi:hypothetical protein
MDNTTNNPDGNNHLEGSKNSIIIWQQNVNRLHTCQHDVISSMVLAKRGIDLIALQEPAINNFGMTITSRDWIPVCPTMHTTNPSKICSLILVRSNVLTEHWKQVNFPSGDVTIINISGDWGEVII